MKLKYCFVCDGVKDANKLHHWIATDSGCECKRCRMTANREDACEILGRPLKALRDKFEREGTIGVIQPPQEQAE